LWVDIVVKGRNVEVPDHYKVHVAEKLSKIERYDHKIIRLDVELLHERNPRQTDHCQRVEITCISKGPVVRAEASAPDFYSALDLAVEKLDNRMRRAAERRRDRRTRRVPLSVAMATAGPAPAGMVAESHAAPNGDGGVTAREDEASLDVEAAPADEREDQWYIARRKEHRAEPMTVDDALFQMELVGHDFYLFQDKETGRPSVVYWRKGYDYGVISLVT